MQSVGYWEAWSLWWSGAKVDGLLMWGVPVLWWGRIGKLAQFAGGLVVIIDLLGSKRLRDMSTVTRTWQGRVRPALTSRSLSEESRSVRWLAGTIVAITAPLAVVLTVAVLMWIWPTSDAVFPDDWPVPIQLVASLLSFVLFLSLVIAVAFGMGWAVSPSLAALAWVFDSDRPGHPMRWLAFTLVVAGFHFDLLAS